MAEKDMLPMATHYYEIGKYQRANDALASMALNIDRKDQIDHHVLLSNILGGLEKHSEALELSDVLLTKFPDDHQCISHWIRKASDDWDRVAKAYEMARTMGTSDPDNYWYPMMMAYMAFDFRLEPNRVIIQLVEQAIGISRNKWTLRLACKVLGALKSPQEIKPYLDELVELAPDAESTYLILLEFLAANKRYTELGQISYEAITKYPNNQELIDYLKMAKDHLYGGFLDRLFHLDLGIGKNFIQRSSINVWFRACQSICFFISAALEILIVISAVLLCVLGVVFFFHFFLVADTERNTRKQRKRRSKKHEFEFDDQITRMNGAVSALVSSTHLAYRFIYIDAQTVVLAEDAWCPVEDLHFDLDTEHLPGHKVIAHQQIRQLEVSSNSLSIITTDGDRHRIYFEKIETYDIIIGQLQEYHYHRVQTKHSSRMLLSLFCFFGISVCLALVGLIFYGYRIIGTILILMVLTNFLSYFIYRFIRPLKTNIYQSSKDMLPVATCSYESGKSQKDCDKITSMALHFDQPEQIDYHVLLSDILDGLEKQACVKELGEAMLKKFPINHQCSDHWIQHVNDDFSRLEKAFDIAHSRQTSDPNLYWYPTVMAYMAYQYRLQSESAIIQRVEQAIDLSCNEQTLRLACTIFGTLKTTEYVKPYLDELLEQAPDAESTYLVLLQFLAKNKRYMELGQVSYKAYRKYPKNQQLVEYITMANDHLYGGFFKKVSNVRIGIGEALNIHRSSNNTWFRVCERPGRYFGMVMGTLIGSLIHVLAILIGGLAALFFFHYFLFACDERNIRKQRKRRSQKHGFEYDDQYIRMNGFAAALVSSTHHKYRFIGVNAHSIVLAKDLLCPVENLNMDLYTEYLVGHIEIAHHQIKQLEVSSDYLTVMTTKTEHYIVYFEKLETFDVVIRQLKEFNFHRVKTKRSSRIILTLFCFLGTKTCLGIVGIISLLSWKIGKFLTLMVFTNFLSLLIYRFLRPLEKDIYIHK